MITKGMGKSCSNCLSKNDHDRLDVFLKNVLDYFESGRITKSDAIGTLAHFIAAVDQKNHGEVDSWLKMSPENLFSS